MKPHILLLFLLLVPGCSHPARPAPALNERVPVTMEYREFPQVQSRRNPSAPLRIVTGQATDGTLMTSFLVTAPWGGFSSGQTFRDGAHVAADRATHKGKATALSAELRAWNLLLKESPVILTQADLEPQCQAHLSGIGGSTPSLSQTFTPVGAEKFARFSEIRTGGVVGIIVDGRVLSAPVIREPVRDGKAEISGGFVSLNEAQILASRLNEAAGGGRKP
jgi:hypothetical protein